jgi:hypothetical protein
MASWKPLSMKQIGLKYSWREKCSLLCNSYCSHGDLNLAFGDFWYYELRYG